MKKTVLLSALFIASGILASCGGSSSSSTSSSSAGGDTVTYKNVNAPIVVWAPGEDAATIDTIVSDYNKNQTDDANKFNITVKAVSEADGGTTLGTDPLVSDYPSLVAAADDHINNLVSKTIVNPLSGNILKQVQENNTEFSVKCVSQGDNVYGFPITADNGYFLWYDATRCDGVDVSSLESLLKSAKEKGYKVLMDVANGWYSASFFFSEQTCGTDSLKYKNNVDQATGESYVTYDCTWDNEKGVETASYLGGLLKPYVDDGTLIKGSNDDIANGFATDGKICAAVSGTWMETSIKAKNPSINLKATKLPTFTIDGTKHQMGSFAGSKLFVVNAYASAAEQKAATYLGLLLTGEKAQLTRYKNRQTIPCNKAALENSEYTSTVSVGAAALSAQSAYAAVQSACAESRYWDIGAAIGQAMLNGDLGKSASWADFMSSKIGSLRLKA